MNNAFEGMGIFGLGKRDVLLLPGCFIESKLDYKLNNYKKILKRLKIKFTVFHEFKCCSAILLEAGSEKQARKLARENFNFLKENNIRKIITLCPLCYKTLKQDYPKMMPDFNQSDIEIEFITDSIYNALKDNPKLIKNKTEETIYFYDSCYSGRHAKIFDSPREILKIIGYNLKELRNNKEHSICCGSCSNLPFIDEKISSKITRYLIRSIGNQKINKLTLIDPRAFFQLKNHVSDNTLEIIEFSNILCQALNISSKEK